MTSPRARKEEMEMIHQCLRIHRLDVTEINDRDGKMMARIVLSSKERKLDYAEVPTERLPLAGEDTLDVSGVFISIKAEKEVGLTPNALILAQFEDDDRPRILYDRREALIAEGEIGPATLAEIGKQLSDFGYDMAECRRFPECRINEFVIS